MLKIGITGGIGSGKTTVCKIFSVLGIPVYRADRMAKIFVNEVSEIREGIIREFGAEAYTPDTYNSKYISKIVFGNKRKLKKLNSIIHPYVAQDFLSWANKQKNTKYLLKEAAILFESGADQNMDYTIVVNAPLDLRIQRIIERDGLSKNMIEQRMKNQWPTEKIRALADWVIENDENHLLLPQVLSIHEQLISL
jgi:dephospho-CoA kinase